MALGVVQTWQYLSLQKNFKKMKIFFLYNSGKNVRDFTYIDDVAESLKKIIFLIN